MVGAMEPNSEASPSGSSHRHGPGAASDRVVLVGGDCPLGIALLDAWEAAGIAATVIGRVLDGAPTTLADHPSTSAATAPSPQRWPAQTSW